MPAHPSALSHLDSARQLPANQSAAAEDAIEVAALLSQRAIFATSVIFTVIPSVAVGLRLVSGRLIRRTCSWADYTIFAASFVVAGYWTTAMIGVVIGGLGSPTIGEMFEDYGPKDVEAAFKAAFVLQILWATASGLYKTSILLFYCEIFPNLRRISSMAIFGVVFMAFGTIIGTLIACDQTEDNWKHIIPSHSECDTRSLTFQTSGAINIATDMVVLLIPVRNILKLQVPRYRRLILITTFTLGWLTCAIGIGRQIDFTEARPPDYSDTPYAMLHVIIFSGVEPSVAVALACVPLMRPLFFTARPGSNGTDDGSDLERRRRAMSISRRTTTRLTGDPLSFPAPSIAYRSTRSLLMRRDSDVSAESFGRAISQISTQTIGRHVL